MKIPAGFTEVTWDEFYELLSRCGAVDPMPKPSPEFTAWETQKGPRYMWGWSLPGYRNPGLPKIYAVRDEVLG